MQVKRMTETSARQQQYLDHGLSASAVPSYGDVGAEAFGPVGRGLVPWTGQWSGHPSPMSLLWESAEEPRGVVGIVLLWMIVPDLFLFRSDLDDLKCSMQHSQPDC